jgi:hypothetical protein
MKLFHIENTNDLEEQKQKTPSVLSIMKILAIKVNKKNFFDPQWDLNVPKHPKRILHLLSLKKIIQRFNCKHALFRQQPAITIYKDTLGDVSVS